MSEVSICIVALLTISFTTSCSKDCGEPENRGQKTFLTTKKVVDSSIDFFVKALRSERTYKQCSTPQFAEAEAVDHDVDISEEKISFKYRLCHLSSVNFNSSPVIAEILSVKDGEAISGGTLSLNQSDIPTGAVATILIYDSGGYLLQESNKYKDPSFLAYASSLIESCIKK
jgi:hypothetical protein